MIKNVMIILLCALTALSCTGVDSGHTGVKIEYGGETDMNKVYDEGLYNGLSWMWNSMVQYETREKTIRVSDTYLDIDGLSVPVDAVIYYKVSPKSVNKLHKEIGEDYEARKIYPLVDAALKNVIPQYRALELNNTHRDQADTKLMNYLKDKFPPFYCEFIGVNLTKILIPEDISKQIVLKQVQDERNALAEKKALEQTNLANAEIERAKGAFEAAKYDAKTKDILSSPKMLELFKAETERVWAEKGVSPWGNNNVFGSSAVLKGYSK